MAKTTIVRVSKTITQTVQMFIDVPVIQQDGDYHGKAENLAIELVKARLKCGHDGGWQSMSPEISDDARTYDGLPRLETEILSEAPGENAIQPVRPLTESEA